MVSSLKSLSFESAILSREESAGPANSRFLTGKECRFGITRYEGRNYMRYGRRS